MIPVKKEKRTIFDSKEYRIRKTRGTVYIAKCKICGRQFKALYESQVKAQITAHILTHKTKSLDKV